jgi:hypothetical protein
MVADVDSELHVGVVAFVLLRAGEVTSANRRGVTSKISVVPGGTERIH